MNRVSYYAPTARLPERLSIWRGYISWPFLAPTPDVDVVPMCMGVNREPADTGAQESGCPHVHGGEPVVELVVWLVVLLSPCAWG